MLALRPNFRATERGRDERYLLGAAVGNLSRRIDMPVLPVLLRPRFGPYYGASNLADSHYDARVGRLCGIAFVALESLL